jgi:cyclopropane fatty-acyl-phospholipid synthase-like methyltransferase
MDYEKIVRHYEHCLDKHGDNHLGVDWPRAEDVPKRYTAMLEIMDLDKMTVVQPSVLDFGCGSGHLLSYLKESRYNVKYSGLDISEKYISLCRSKFPNVQFHQFDVLKTPEKLGPYDYVLMNGVFTEKREASYENMLSYFFQMLRTVFAKANRGIAFNVMSKHVDWERDDLFHLGHDVLAAFLVKELSRNYVMRNDYGLYEYTTYVYK